MSLYIYIFSCLVFGKSPEAIMYLYHKCGVHHDLRIFRKTTYPGPDVTRSKLSYWIATKMYMKCSRNVFCTSGVGPKLAGICTSPLLATKILLDWTCKFSLGIFLYMICKYEIFSNLF